jgi:FkbM family methyltransferase
MIRSNCVTAYLGENVALCRVLGRHKMFVDTRDIGLSTHLMLDGYWEMWLTEMMARVIKPGMTVGDVGANLGYFTLLMAELVGPEGRVHAFEPNPAVANLLARSTDINGFRDRVTLHTDPLGDVDGAPVFLAVPPGEPKNAHITKNSNYPGAIALTTRRLDAYPDMLCADVIKIDAEGAELDIWRGMSGLLAGRTKPMTLFMEFAACRYPNPGAFIDELTASGLALAVLETDGSVASRTRAQILEAPHQIDQMLVLTR